MSLINEALKKAQRQRTEDPVVLAAIETGTGGGIAPRIAKRRPPMPARTLVLLIGGGTAVLFMAGVLAFLFLGEEPVPPSPVKPLAALVPPPGASRVDAVVPPEPVTPPVIAVSLPPVTAVPPPATTSAPAPVPALPPAPAVHPVPVKPVAPTANPRVYEFLETLHVAGIRVSDTDPKVIMNDRVFRLNDLVDRATQLRLLRVDSSSLIFIDAGGFEYRKNF